VPSGKHDLTDNEGTLLSLVLRIQPTTSYQIIKIYSESPVSNFNTSKGKIYPLINRLEQAGLISKRRIESDRRRTEELHCTTLGKKAVRDWILKIRPEHLLLDDPLRTKVQSFDLLSPEERAQWILDAKEELHRKLDEVEDYGRSVEVPFKEFVHDNAVRSLRARIDWLDRMYIYLKKSEAA
jgi:DNA-binding PadR family transcriptional regulator